MATQTTRKELISERTALLRKAVQNYIDEHEAWANDRSREHADERYWNAVESMLSVFSEADDLDANIPAVPSACRDLAAAVMEFSEQLRILDESDELLPHEDFWRAREKLFEAYHRPIPVAPHVPSILDLHQQKVPHEQIAKMWGLLDERGTPAVHLVRRELDQPGSVIDADYEPPEVRQWREKYHGDQEEAVKSVKREEPKQESCLETLKDLFDQEVSAAQAAKMTGKPVAEVEKEYEVLRRRRSDLEKQRSAPPTSADPYPEMTDADLRGELKERYGRSMHPNTGRAKLIAALEEEFLKAEEENE